MIMDETMLFQAIDELERELNEQIKNNRKIEVKNFEGKSIILDTFANVNSALINEMRKESLFLKYIYQLSINYSKVAVINNKINEIRDTIENNKKLISTIKDKKYGIKAIISQKIGELNDYQEKLLVGSCAGNVKLYNLLNDDNIESYIELKNKDVFSDEQKHDAHNLLLNNSPDFDEINRVDFIINKLLFYKRQLFFRERDIQKNIKFSNEGIRHLQNVKNTIINQTNRIKNPLHDADEYEINTIYNVIKSLGYVDESIKMSKISAIYRWIKNIKSCGRIKGV